MQKPFTVLRDDFTNQMIALINNSGIPACVIADVLADLHRLVMQQANHQLAADRAAYEEALQAEDAGEEAGDD